MENYFNRNSIRAADFFDDYDVESLLNIWEVYHHTIQNYDRKPAKTQSYGGVDGSLMMYDSIIKQSSLNMEGREGKMTTDEKSMRILELEK